MDFDDLIINLVRKAEPDLDSRLDSQAEALKEFECTNIIFGRWIDEYDVEYLMAAFNLDDDEFSSEFPAIADLNQHDRSQIIEAFEKHFDQCPHCYLKRGYDLEMNARIERAYSLNNEEVAQFLQSQQATRAPEVATDATGNAADTKDATEPARAPIDVDELLLAATVSLRGDDVQLSVAGVNLDEVMQAAKKVRN